MTQGDSPPYPPEALLAHMDFVRKLARSLLADSHESSDLEQDAWLRALEKPPRRRSNLRNWLAILIRNLVRNRRRATRLREQHEARAEPATHVDPTAEVVAQEAARRRVVTAVLQLSEPYRTTIVRCYFDGLSLAEIARQSGVPAATVRSRLRRALELLRRHLDSEHDMRRSAWALPLVPLARPGAWEGIPTTSATSSGILAMNTKLILGIAVVVLCALGLGVAALGYSRNDVEPTGPRSAVVDHKTVHESVLPVDDDQTSKRESLAGTASGGGAIDSSEPDIYPRDVALATIHGFVTTPNGDPAADVAVQLISTTNNVPPGMDLKDDRLVHRHTRTDAQGVFAFQDLPEGPYEVQASDEGMSCRSSVAVASGKNKRRLFLQLDNRGSPRDPIVDVSDGKGAPARDVPVEFIGLASGQLVGMDGVPTLTIRTDENGRAVFRGQILEEGIVIAESTDGRTAWKPVDERCGGWIRLRFVPPGKVRGKVRGSGGAGVQIHARAWQWCGHGRTWSAPARNNRYEFPSLAPGRYELTVTSPAGICLAPSPQPIRVRVETGEVVNRDLKVTKGGRLEGRILDSSGKPVAGARVLVKKVRPPSSERDRLKAGDALIWRLQRHVFKRGRHLNVGAVSGTDGQYVVDGLQPGRYHVDVLAPALCHDLQRIDVQAGTVQSIEHRLEPDGVLQGVAHLGVYGGIGLRPEGAQKVTCIAMVSRGVFTFPKLRSGRYEIWDVALGRPRQPSILGRARVRAGQTTWVDLRDHWVQVEGVVLDEDGPVSGVRVSNFARHLSTTDSEGRFTAQIGLAAIWQPKLRLGAQIWGFGRDGKTAGPAEPCVLKLPSGKLQIVTLDHHGKPCSADVHLSSAFGGMGRRWTNAYLQISKDGKTTVHHLFGGLDGAYRVRARFPNKGFFESTVQVPRQTPLVLRAMPVGSLAVTVRDSHGHPAPYLSVLAITHTESDQSANRQCSPQRYQQAETDTHGVAHLKGVTAGDVEIDTGLEDEEGSYRATRRVRVAPDRHLQITMVLRKQQR